MITIAMLNMKGGVGKTTLAVNLSWHLARQGKKVLLVDLDPQFNASQYLMTFERYAAHRKKSGTVADILLDSGRSRLSVSDKADPKKSLRTLAQVEVSPDRKGYLFLLPSELELASAVKNPQGVEFRLQKAMATWEPYFEYAFIDCAPTDTVLTATALMAADYVMVPIKPDRFSILGYGMIKEIFTRFKADYPDPKGVRDLGVVFTHVTRGGSHDIEEDCKKQVAKEASYVFKTEVATSTSYLRAIHEQSPVFDTRYARAVTRQTITDLVDEIEVRIKSIVGSSKSAPVAATPAKAK